MTDHPPDARAPAAPNVPPASAAPAAPTVPAAAASGRLSRSRGRRRLRRLWVGFRRTMQRLIAQRATPHSIALGTSIGVFIALLPLMGIQMILGALVATPVKANRLAAMLPAWITNPATAVPVYYFCYRVGCWILPGYETGRWHRLAAPLKTAITEFGNYHFWESVRRFFSALASLGGEVLWPLFLGCAVVGLICAVATYPVMYWLVNRVRRLQQLRREHRRAHWRGVVTAAVTAATGTPAAPAESPAAPAPDASIGPVAEPPESPG